MPVCRCWTDRAAVCCASARVACLLWMLCFETSGYCTSNANQPVVAASVRSPCNDVSTVVTPHRRKFDTLLRWWIVETPVVVVLRIRCWCWRVRSITASRWRAWRSSTECSLVCFSGSVYCRHLLGRENSPKSSNFLQNILNCNWTDGRGCRFSR